MILGHKFSTQEAVSVATSVLLTIELGFTCQSTTQFAPLESDANTCLAFLFAFALPCSDFHFFLVRIETILVEKVHVALRAVNLVGFLANAHSLAHYALGFASVVIQFVVTYTARIAIVCTSEKTGGGNQ